MKRFIAFILLMAVLLCGCDMQQTAERTFRTLLEKVASNQELQNWLEQHPAEEMTTNARNALFEKFPTLEELTDFDDLKQLLKTTGLELLEQYLHSTTPGTQAKAETLGAIIQILSPDLTDEVEAILSK